MKKDGMLMGQVFFALFCVYAQKVDDLKIYIMYIAYIIFIH